MEEDVPASIERLSFVSEAIAFDCDETVTAALSECEAEGRGALRLPNLEEPIVGLFGGMGQWRRRLLCLSALVLFAAAAEVFSFVRPPPPVTTPTTEEEDIMAQDVSRVMRCYLV